MSGLTLFLALVASAIVLARAFSAHSRLKVSDALKRAERDAILLQPLEARVGGRAITRGWNYVRTEQRQTIGNSTANVDLNRYRATVHGLLPPWVQFGWQALGPAPAEQSAHGRNELFLTALFEPSAFKRLPRGATLYGSQGDLALESEDHDGRPDHKVARYTEVLVEFACAYLSLGEGRAIERIAALALSELPVGIDALRLLARNLPSRPETDRALAHARESSNAGLRAIAACVDGAAGHAALKVIAFDVHASVSARREAIEGLIALNDLESVIALLPSMPAGSLRGAIQATSKKPSPGASLALVGFLSHTDLEIVEATADTLARIGTIEAVEPLLACRGERTLPERVRTAIDIAVELIQDRAGGIEQRGGLALTAGPDDRRGQLAMAEPTGTLALAQAKTDPEDSGS